MDFFALQSEAHRRTHLLVGLFAVCVLLVMALTAGVFVGLGWLFFAPRGRPFWECVLLGEGRPWAGLCVLASAVLVGVSGWLAGRRNAGAAEILARFGAKEVRPQDAPQLSHVVEEMSLASGVARPQVWQVEALGVNAFVVGREQSDAALCVTTGAVRRLTRDELQGLVAHEFAHILNGDMGLNTRLASYVAAVAGVSGVAAWLFRSAREMLDDTSFFSWGSRRDRGLYLVPLAFVLAALLGLVGGIGKMLARLLQGAVSRQREYLADAAAVQFTRQPEALADVLRLAHRMPAGSWACPGAGAACAAHLLFVGVDWGGFRTHPPLAERVRRLSPAGLEANAERFRSRLDSYRQAVAERCAARDRAFDAARRRAEKARHLQEAVRPADSRLPLAFCQRVWEADAAGRVLLDLLEGRPVPELGEPTPRVRRLAVNQAATALRSRGTPEEIRAWRQRLTERLDAEGEEMPSFSFFVQCTVQRRLDACPPPSRANRGRQRLAAARVVSTVAWMGDHADRAYAQTEGRMAPLFSGWPARPEPCGSVPDFLAELGVLRTLQPLGKREVLEALRTVVAEDGELSEDEGNYLDAVAEAMEANGWNLV